MTDGQKNELVKNLRKLAITKQLNFLIGSGASLPAIPLMGMIDEKDKDTRNEILTEKVKIASNKLLENQLDSEPKITETLRNYREFISQIIEILNLSNSRQTPR